MEPIPVYFDLVERSTIIIKPKQPFFEWLKSIDNEDDFSDLKDETDVYLIPDFETKEEITRWLKKNFDMIFCDQMNHWYTNEEIWTQKRTFKVFCDWFDFSIHTTIWDTLDEPIEK
jgi:hypothetical protein